MDGLINGWIDVYVTNWTKTILINITAMLANDNTKWAEWQSHLEVGAVNGHVPACKYCQ